MAEGGVKLDRETFSCSICLDLLKDPVTVPCGHSYCMKCIGAHWDGEDEQGIHSCPQCRKTFRPRPDVELNTMLAVLVEELRKAGVQAAPADHHFAGPGDVACDVCTGRKRKAVKSCLFCPASYCGDHLQPHYHVPSLKKHQLVEPSKNLQEDICSRHDEVMKLFCRTDQQLICYLCSVAEHKDHDTVSAAAERTEKQKELEESRLNIQQRIQDKEKDLELLQQELEVTAVSADKTLYSSWQIFEAVINLIQYRRDVLHQQITSQQEAEQRQGQELYEKLQQEIRELNRKASALQQLSDTPDCIQFLHNYPPVSVLRNSTRSSRIDIHPRRHFEKVVDPLEKFKEKIQCKLKNHWERISHIVNLPDMLLLESEPKTRAEFWRYSRDITVDPNTACRQLVLSDGDRKITLRRESQRCPHHPHRFTSWTQALSRELLTGRCYWEVEWRGKSSVAVSYPSIDRTTYDSGFGMNDKSWSLCWKEDRFEMKYKNITTPIFGPRPSRIGVYLDHSAGVLSFYDVCETVTLIHRVQTTFTEPLHAGLETDESAEFCKLK